MEVKRPYNVFIRYLGLTVQNHYPVTMAIHAKSNLTFWGHTYYIFFCMS